MVNINKYNYARLYSAVQVLIHIFLMIAFALNLFFFHLLHQIPNYIVGYQIF